MTTPSIGPATAGLSGFALFSTSQPDTATAAMKTAPANRRNLVFLMRDLRPSDNCTQRTLSYRLELGASLVLRGLGTCGTAEVGRALLYRDWRKGRRKKGQGEASLVPSLAIPGRSSRRGRNRYRTGGPSSCPCRIPATSTSGWS